jgi:hypothetical protein
MRFDKIPFSRLLIKKFPLVLFVKMNQGAFFIQKRQLIFEYDLFYFGQGISLSHE